MSQLCSNYSNGLKVLGLSFHMNIFSSGSDTCIKRDTLRETPFFRLLKARSRKGNEEMEHLAFVLDTSDQLSICNFTIGEVGLYHVVFEKNPSHCSNVVIFLQHYNIPVALIGLRFTSTSIT